MKLSERQWRITCDSLQKKNRGKIVICAQKNKKKEGSGAQLLTMVYKEEIRLPSGCLS